MLLIEDQAIAQKASGKTTFATDLARAVVHGAPFLDRTTKRSAVVWLTEERPQTFLETLRRSHLTEQTDVHVLHWHAVKHRAWPDVMALANDFALSIGAAVVIVDTISTWAGMRGDSENDNGDQLAAAEPLQDAAAKGLAVVVTRHERKGGGEVGESGLGGSAFSGAVDIIVSIRRGARRRAQCIAGNSAIKGMAWPRSTSLRDSQRQLPCP